MQTLAFRRHAAAIIIVPLLLATTAGAQLRIGHFSTRDVPADPYLEDFRADFSFDYPLDWSLRSPVSGAEVIVMGSMGQPPAIEGSIAVVPLHVGPQTDPALTLALTKMKAGEFETSAFAGAPNYKKTFEGETSFNGMRAYEIHNSGSPGAAGQGTVLGRLIFILPTDTTSGVLVVLGTIAGFNGIDDAARIGESGDLAVVAKSFRMIATSKAADTMKTFVNRREKTPPKLLPDYFDFSFRYPRSWDLMTSISEPSMFASVHRGIMRNGIANFSTDHFTVGYYDVGGKPGSGTIPELSVIGAEVEKGISTGFTTYKKTSQGETTVSGIKGYEFRYTATLPSPNAKGVTYYGRVIVLPASAENGAIITMMATSLSAGVKGPEDVGEKGDLGVLVRGFVMGKRGEG